MPQVIKTRKIKLIPVAESTQDKKEIYKYIKKVASDLSQAGNKVVRVHILNQFEIENNITEKGLKPQEANELLKKKLGGWCAHDAVTFCQGDLSASGVSLALGAGITS